MKAVPKRFLYGAGIASTLALAPVTYSQSEGIKVNEAACQSGTCCYEAGSICGMNGSNYWNYYYKSSGSCSRTQVDEPPGG